MWFVYVLQHSITREVYIGRTNDLKRRLREHNDSSKKSTQRKSGEWHIVYSEIYRSKDDAVRRELRLKDHGRAKQELLRRISKSLLSWNQKVVLDAAKVSLATVYQKHSSLRTRKRMYRGWRLTDARRLTVAVRCVASGISKFEYRNSKQFEI